MKRGFATSAAPYLALLVSTFSIVWAQGIRATLLGRVTDQSGAVVPGAKVTVVNIGTNAAQSVVVGDNAEFVFPQLAPGQYTLTTEHEGFRKDVRTGITLEVGQQARMDVALQVGAVSEQIEVTAAAPLISSESAAIGNVVDQKKIVELPLNGRGYLQLAFLQPGVLAPAQGSTIGFRGGMNIAGSNEVSTQYILDGVDNNDEASNQPLHTPVLDSVQEFRVLTGTYSAEYGRQAGGQVIVTTKSGTNAFHGTAWDFYRNSALDARNFFAPQKLSFIRNQYGVTLGGPIRTNKTFFFVAWENQNRGNGVSSLALVPPAAFRNGDFSSLSTALRNPAGGTFSGNQIPKSLWSSQGAGLLALYPLPNLNSTTNNIVSSSKGLYDSDQFSARVDHRFGEKDQVYGSYQFLDSHEFYPLSNPLCSARSVQGWGCQEMQRTQQATSGWTHIFSPNLVNEARVGYIRFGFYRIQEDSNVDIINSLKIGGLPDAGVTPFNNGAPQLALTGYVTIGGPTNLPQGRHDNNYNYIENMTWTKGSHTMKWGVDYLHILFNSFFTSNGRGAFAFQNTFTGNSVADLLLGLPQSATRNPGTPFHNAIADNYGFYFQDDWKVTPKFTINYGLRWELDLPLRERVDKMASFDPITNTLKDAQGFRWHIENGLLVAVADASLKGAQLWETDRNNFGPRLGIAWRPWGGTKTVIRGGFGTFYNHQIAGNGITPLNRNSPYRNSQTAGPFSATSVPLPNLANAFSGNPSATPPGIATNFKTSYTNEWSFGVQREVASNLLVEVNYVGNESHRLPTVWNINQAFPGTVGSVQSRRPYQPWGNITGGFISSIGNSNYHGLQARLERRFAHGLSFVASYSWSKAIDIGGNISTGSNNSNGSAQDARNLQGDRALADFNVPHRFVGSFVWDLPGTRSNKVLGYIVSGWQVKGILTAQQGQPFTVYDGIDQSSTGANNDRPIVIGDWHVDNPGVSGWFNTCTILANGARSNCQAGQNPAWQIAPAGTFGNAGRNILSGPGLFNFDTGLSRQFKVTERVILQFRGELFNVLNRANFFLPTTSLSSSAYGSIAQAADQPNTGAQRQIQFAMKIVF